MGPAEEDFPTLKRDEEFVKDVFSVFKDGNRDKIRRKILDPRLSLALKCPEGVSLASKLLTEVTNGDKIFLEKLDQCITTTHDDPHNKDYGVIMDYRYLVDDDSRNFCILTDILEVPRNATIDIMDHPVITTFITRRWPKFLYVTMALVYLVFVLTFTTHLLFIFSRHDSTLIGRIFGKDCTVGEWSVCENNLEKTNGGKNKRVFNQTTDCTRACLAMAPFEACTDKKDPWMCASEIFLILSMIVLLAQELWQAIALRVDYIREAENFFEWLIIGLAFAVLFIKESEWLAAISSITVLLAWIQLIFIIGRLPSYMGEFSLMYYASVKKILMIALGFFTMILAFGLAFFFLHFEFTKGKGGTIFTTLPKSLITSFVWFMGGVDLESLWAESEDDGLGGGEVGIIAMILLMAMMLFGTLIMFNLIVATIITDMDWLKEEAKDTNLRNQASNAVQAGVATKPFHREKEWEQNQLELMVCLHSVCGPCGKENVTDDEKSRILDIIEKGKGQQSSNEKAS